MNQKGFTLIEFVVIISIFAIMAGVALVNFNGFKSNVSLNNLSHDIALTIRQAQVFGWATKTQNGDNNGVGEVVQLGNNGAGDPIRFADGVYFSYDNGSYAKEFLLYSKNDSTLGYESYISTDTVIDTIKIQGPNHISAIKYGDSKDDLILPNDRTIPPGNGDIESFSVAFSRPHPDALFFNNGIPLTGPNSTFVGIYISADGTDPLKADHVITISRFGEIAVQ
jgi:prepilin-type N-terminal cleavage/methylation domain-containing protein